MDSKTVGASIALLGLLAANVAFFALIIAAGAPWQVHLLLGGCTAIFWGYVIHQAD